MHSVAVVDVVRRNSSLLLRSVRGIVSEHVIDRGKVGHLPALLLPLETANSQTYFEEKPIP